MPPVGESYALFYVCSAIAWTWTLFWIMAVGVCLASLRDAEQAMSLFVVGSFTFQWTSVLLFWSMPTITFALLGLLAKPRRRR